jgi:hypothetical protein
MKKSFLTAGLMMLGTNSASL